MTTAQNKHGLILFTCHANKLKIIKIGAAVGVGKAANNKISDERHSINWKSVQGSVRALSTFKIESDWLEIE